MRGRRPSRALRCRPLNCELEAQAGRGMRDIRSRGPILLDMENPLGNCPECFVSICDVCVTRVPFVRRVCAMSVFVCLHVYRDVVCLRTHARATCDIGLSNRSATTRDEFMRHLSRRFGRCAARVCLLRSHVQCMPLSTAGTWKATLRRLWLLFSALRRRAGVRVQSPESRRGRPCPALRQGGCCLFGRWKAAARAAYARTCSVPCGARLHMGPFREA